VKRFKFASLISACLLIASPSPAWVDSLGSAVSLGKAPEIISVSPDGRWKIINLEFSSEVSNKSGKTGRSYVQVIEIGDARTKFRPEDLWEEILCLGDSWRGLSGFVRHAQWTRDSKTCIVTYNGLHQPYNISIGLLRTDGGNAVEIPNEAIGGHISPYFDLKNNDDLSLRVYKQVPWNFVEGGPEAAPDPSDPGILKVWSIRGLISGNFKLSSKSDARK
jgi:hypothetical protein